MACFTGLWPVSNVQELFIDVQLVQRCMHSFYLNTSSTCHVTLAVGVVRFPRNLHYFDVFSSKLPMKRRCHRHNYCTLKCHYLSILNAATVRVEILKTHIFTIPLTLTNHVNRSECNDKEVHIRRVINSVQTFIV